MARVFSASMFVLLALQFSVEAAAREPSDRSKYSRPTSEHRVKARPAVRLTRHEERLVDAVTEYREKHGLETLKVDPVLMKVARHAAPHYSHCINGKWCWHRAKEAGFSGWATDDIANGYETP